MGVSSSARKYIEEDDIQVCMKKFERKTNQTATTTATAIMIRRETVHSNSRFLPLSLIFSMSSYPCSSPLSLAALHHFFSFFFCLGSLFQSPLAPSLSFSPTTVAVFKVVAV